jgi:hypothetical protein
MSKSNLVLVLHLHLRRCRDNDLSGRMMRRWRTTVAAVAAVACVLLVPAHAQQLDVTKLLLSRPEAAKGIADLCERACAGNERQSRLEMATLTISGATAPMVLDATIKLRSRHVPLASVVLYDDTATLNVRATLDPVTCKVTDVKMSSNNDLYQFVIRIFGPSLAGELSRALLNFTKRALP